MNIRYERFTKALLMLLAAGFCVMGTCACSSDSDVLGSCITLSEDGTVSDCIRESFDKDYYDEKELQEEILQAVADYNNRTGAERVTVDRIQVQDDVTDVKMNFATSDDYADFNREIFFVGTPLEAKEAGYDLNHVFIGTEDASQTMGEAELLASTGMKVLITNTDQSVSLYHQILFVSDKVLLSGRNKVFQIKNDENEPASREVCIIFKE